MKFTKMQGCGNDYIYIDGYRESVKDPQKMAKLVSDRHFGIGSDGLIIINPSESADCQMLMYNLDGSRGAMCGNGIRCVGKYVYEHGIVNKKELTVETDSGIKLLKLTIAGEKVEMVSVNMGIPVLTSNQNTQKPSCSNKEQLMKFPYLERIVVDNKDYEIISLSIGNPHAVVFMDKIHLLNLETIGPNFEHHSRFPDRTNTEFVEVVDRSHIKMRVWERGAGETLACGTGACAAAIAAMLAGYVDTCIQVELLGGSLGITWDQQTGQILMEGPAVEVFQGEIDC